MSCYLLLCRVHRPAPLKLIHSTLHPSRPREAAFEIVHLINSRNQNVALLALAVGFCPDILNRA